MTPPGRGQMAKSGFSVITRGGAQGADVDGRGQKMV